MIPFIPDSLMGELIRIYTYNGKNHAMNYIESFETYRTEVEYLGEAFVQPLAKNPNSLKGYFFGGLLPLAFLGLVWSFLLLLWRLFFVSVLATFHQHLNPDILLFVFILFAVWSHFWFLLSRSILVSLLKAVNHIPLSERYILRKPVRFTSLASLEQECYEPIGRCQ